MASALKQNLDPVRLDLGPVTLRRLRESGILAELRVERNFKSPEVVFVEMQ